MLKEEEWERMELTYNELMRKISRQQRRKRIWERGFDTESSMKIRREMGLPSFKQVVEKRRLNFAADVLTHHQHRKVCRVMKEEMELGGEWWVYVEQDRSKYGIESKEHLISLKTTKFSLEKLMDNEISKQDLEEEKSIIDALPDSQMQAQ